MVLIRLVVITIWVLAFLAGHVNWTARVTAVHRLPNTAVFEFPQLDRAQPAAERLQPSRDLYGNEVDDAVGEYLIDPRGDVYEQHAPDTAVLKLGPAGV